MVGAGAGWLRYLGFYLLCGYAADNFTGGKRGTGFEDVCGQHHVVVPIESRAHPES